MATQTLLKVEGMTCTSCTRHVGVALRGVEGVQDVEVSLQTGEARVTHDAAEAPPADLIEAVREAGYDAQVRAA